MSSPLTPITTGLTRAFQLANMIHQQRNQDQQMAMQQQQMADNENLQQSNQNRQNSDLAMKLADWQQASGARKATPQDLVEMQTGQHLDMNPANADDSTGALMPAITRSDIKSRAINVNGDQYILPSQAERAAATAKAAQTEADAYGAKEAAKATALAPINLKSKVDEATAMAPITAKAEADKAAAAQKARLDEDAALRKQSGIAPPPEWGMPGNIRFLPKEYTEAMTAHNAATRPQIKDFTDAQGNVTYGIINPQTHKVDVITDPRLRGVGKTPELTPGQDLVNERFKQKELDAAQAQHDNLQDQERDQWNLHANLADVIDPNITKNKDPFVDNTGSRPVNRIMTDGLRKQMTGAYQSSVQKALELQNRARTIRAHNHWGEFDPTSPSFNPQAPGAPPAQGGAAAASPQSTPAPAPATSPVTAAPAAGGGRGAPVSAAPQFKIGEEVTHQGRKANVVGFDPQGRPQIKYQ